MIASAESVAATLSAVGEHGTMIARNPLAPQMGGSELVVDLGGDRTITTPEGSATYLHQLVAFRDAIVERRPFPSTADDGVRMMELIDGCYRAAGLSPRPAAEPAEG